MLKTHTIYRVQIDEIFSYESHIEDVSIVHLWYELSGNRTVSSPVNGESKP